VDLEDLVAMQDRMRADHLVAGSLSLRHADLRLEPLPRGIDQRHGGDWRGADVGGEPREVVEDRFASSSLNP